MYYFKLEEQLFSYKVDYKVNANKMNVILVLDLVVDF